MSNHLIHETSPYLLQHAHNPVDWYPWGQLALDKAKKEDKPIIVSIGYSACHWCHVMERESFENEALSVLMNEKFICIKVDREERPDIDQIYMDAVQAMGIQGGWPLNVFLMPDTKPFYGGTYFPPNAWDQVLNNVSNAFITHKDQLTDSAEKFAQFIAESQLEKYNLTDSNSDFTKEGLDKIYQNLSRNFDPQNGGMNKAPKFPMPSHYFFLLRYYAASGNELALNHVKLTLDKMAAGGIYDQVGGGFARYSVDAHWFAPHFEKMLYDNAQLINLYSEAFQLTKEARYKEVVFESINFLERELRDSEGGFYSALDADSEGIEGKFYIWEKSELQELLGKDEALFSEFYNVETHGNWEHNYNILNYSTNAEAFAKKHGISSDEFGHKLESWKTLLLKRRENRIRPGLDDKILTSWNGLMLKGLCAAFAAFNDQKFLALAVKNAQFIEENLISDNGRLWHSYKKGKATIIAFLEDYAAVIDGMTALYQITFDEKWLSLSKKLADYVIAHFYDESEEFFYFTDDSAEKLIARKKEIFDNVIPASNSIMAINLFALSQILEDKTYAQISDKMIGKMEKLILSEPQYLSNWACLYYMNASTFYEIAIVGKNLKETNTELNQFFIPNKLVCGTLHSSDLPLLKGRSSIGNDDTIYVCYNKSCKLPVHNVSEALAQMKS